MLVGERVVGGGVGWGWVLNICVFLEKYRGMEMTDLISDAKNYVKYIKMNVQKIISSPGFSYKLEPGSRE